MTESTVTLDEALKLLALPRELGAAPGTGQPIVAGLGRFGPYVKHGDDFRSLERDDDLFTVDLDARARAARGAEAVRRGRRAKRVIRKIEVTDGGAALQVLEGRYGPYVTDGETNASIPKGTDPGDAVARARRARCSRRAAARRRAEPRRGRARRRAVAAARRAPPAKAVARSAGASSEGQVKAKARRKTPPKRSGSESARPQDARADGRSHHRRRPRRSRGRLAGGLARRAGRRCTRCGRSRPTAVHKTDRLAELVCSNSFRGDKLDNAVGLLKEEMRRLGSLVMRAAEASRVPAGAALAVDRERFAEIVTRRDRRRIRSITDRPRGGHARFPSRPSAIR